LNHPDMNVSKPKTLAVHQPHQVHVLTRIAQR
jgi:hypothetical protein